MTSCGGKVEKSNAVGWAVDILSWNGDMNTGFLHASNWKAKVRRADTAFDSSLTSAH